MSGNRLRDRAALAAAVVAPFLVALLLVPFRENLSATNEALILVIVVVAVAALGTRAAGGLAALSAAAWFDFFLTRPYGQFTVENGDELQTAVLLLVTGLIVGQIAVRARTLQGEVRADEADLARLEGTVRLTEEGTGPGELVEHVRGELVQLLGLRGARFEPEPHAGHGHPAARPAGRLPRLEHGGTVWLGLGTDDAECTYWPDRWPDEQVELPVTAAGHPYGRFVLDPVPGALPPLQARRVAVALAAQAGAALQTVQGAGGEQG
ncbi:DUF4118 domain-containing protein [Streptomyces sp. NPDC048603]|uniref:DUF4118 domain-containing protein n=1 Tax=Streptomyces sp. NPDC048603 TaxID=3365577 RepID=UPI003712A7F6